MMKKNYVIISTVIIAAFIVILSTLTFSESQSNVINSNLTEKGTKLALKNNNNDVWEHMDLEIQNVTLENGTRQNINIEAWIEPGGTLIIDLSNIMGFENKPLPIGTNINVKSRCGLYNPQSGGNDDYSLTMQGWSNSTTKIKSPQSNVTMKSLPIGKLPSNINQNTAILSSVPEKDEAYNETNEVVLTEFLLNMDSKGNLQIIFIAPPNLSPTATDIF